MASLHELLATCERAAKAGAEQLLAWQYRITALEKSARDLVTEADLASQTAIREAIAEKYPLDAQSEHGFLGEEYPDFDQLRKPYCWIVDPLDGTTNYVHGFPCYAVSVAVACDGKLVAGVVYDLVRGECFSASDGGGSFLNGNPIAVTEVTELEQSLVAISFPPNLQPDSPDLQAFLQVAPRCQAVRRTGSAALNLAYVACGRLDAHWAHFIHPWDSAAGVLLVREAGGVSTASSGGEYQLRQGNYAVAATPELHAKLMPLISG